MENKLQKLLKEYPYKIVRADGKGSQYGAKIYPDLGTVVGGHVSERVAMAEALRMTKETGVQHYVVQVYSCSVEKPPAPRDIEWEMQRIEVR